MIIVSVKTRTTLCLEDPHRRGYSNKPFHYLAWIKKNNVDGQFHARNEQQSPVYKSSVLSSHPFTLKFFPVQTLLFYIIRQLTSSFAPILITMTARGRLTIQSNWVEMSCLHRRPMGSFFKEWQSRSGLESLYCVELKYTVYILCPLRFNSTYLPGQLCLLENFVQPKLQTAY